MSKRGLPLLIAGGGIGGLAAALALAQRGRGTHVLEQGVTFAEVGAGIQLGPNVFRMFDVLGLTDAISDVAFFPDNLVMHDALTGAEITRVPVNGRAYRERFKHPYGVIYRVDLLNVLLAACRRSELVTLTTSCKVTGVDQHRDGVVVKTADGQMLEGSALIGADGLWSKVRESVVGDGKPRVSGHVAYRGVLPIGDVEERYRPNSVVLWGGPKIHLVHYPLRRGEIFNLVAVFHSDRYEEGWNVFGDTEELNARFRHAHPTVRLLLGKIDTWKMWVLCDREPIKDWTRGRVTLLGDAAHPMLQYLAQGAGMAIEDAVVLANKVAAMNDDHAAAFRAYNDERYLRTGRVQLYARLYGELYHAAGATAEIRNQLIRPDPSKPPGEAMAWLYEGIATT
ncbi:MAG TPA: 3-hydroxybenzoate 6-monooxygenase [Casimicrobiaceae bacterium]|nr:3-hydroxybenzoate 6-monooxygenase [Casimicrobiaceae bacterium]